MSDLGCELSVDKLLNDNDTTTGDIEKAFGGIICAKDIIESVDSYEDQVRVAMLNAGIEPPDDIQFDGDRHRFNSNDKPGVKDGWYVLFQNDGIPAGVFGHWRDLQEGITWHANIGRELTTLEIETNRIRIEQIKAEKAKELIEKQAEAAINANHIYSTAKNATNDHPYLIKKGIDANGLKVSTNNKLIVPIYNNNAKLTSLQFIDTDGSKRFLPGGEIKGCYFWLMGNRESTVFICEGFATAASVYKATGCLTIIAFNSGNIPSVAKIIRPNLPRVVIIADNDIHGAGYKAANKAAIESDCEVVVIPIVGMDANDFEQSGHDLESLLSKYKPIQWLLDAGTFLDQPIFPEWIIENWLQQNAAMMLVGPSGTGKTFLALDMGLHIACGINKWNNYIVEQGTVIYLAGEGHIGLRGRIAAWATHNKRRPENFFVSQDGCDIDKDNGIEKIITNIESMGINPVLIIVDTLHRFMSGDENKSQDARVVLNNCSRLMVRLQCSVILIHHTGVAEAAQGRARGSSAWRGAMDIEILIKPGKEKTDPMEIIQTKSKDFASPLPMNAYIKPTEIPGWFDKYGKQFSSAVLEYQPITFAPTSETPPPKKPTPLEKYTKILERAFWHGGAVVKINPDLNDRECPYVDRQDLHRLLMIDGMASATAANYIKPASKLIKTLLDGNIIAKYGQTGWFIIDNALASIMMMERTDKNKQ